MPASPRKRRKPETDAGKRRRLLNVVDNLRARPNFRTQGFSDTERNQLCDLLREIVEMLTKECFSSGSSTTGKD